MTISKQLHTNFIINQRFISRIKRLWLLWIKTYEPVNLTVKKHVLFNFTCFLACFSHLFHRVWNRRDLPCEQGIFHRVRTYMRNPVKTLWVFNLWKNLWMTLWKTCKKPLNFHSVFHGLGRKSQNLWTGHFSQSQNLWKTLWNGRSLPRRCCQRSPPCLPQQKIQCWSLISVP